MFGTILIFLQTHIKSVVIGTIAVAGSGAVIIPSFFESPEKNYLFKEYKLDNSNASNVGGVRNSSVDFQVVPYSYKDLLRGTTQYNQGNYVLYYGSEKCPYCNVMMYGSQEKQTKTTANSFNGTSFNLAYKHAQTNEKLKSLGIKFLVFSDVPPSVEDKTNDDLHVLPWTTQNKESFEGGKISTEYVRNDESAIQFRKIMEAAKTYFDKDKVSTIPKVIVYKGGVPRIYRGDKFPELEAKITKPQTQTENKDEISSDRYDSLKDYIHYYFSNTFITYTDSATSS